MEHGQGSNRHFEFLHHRDHRGGCGYPGRTTTLSHHLPRLLRQEDAQRPELGEENVGLLDDGRGQQHLL